MAYSISQIKLAAYNWKELPQMTHAERQLWQGLGYCYEWYRSHNDEKDQCDALAKHYIEAFEKGMWN